MDPDEFDIETWLFEADRDLEASTAAEIDVEAMLAKVKQLAHSADRDPARLASEAGIPAEPADDPPWQSPADEGWQAAQALLNKTPEAKTQAGLPKRAPRAHLVPGTVAPPVPSAQQTQRVQLPPRSPDAIRDRFSSYQDAMRRGRHARDEEEVQNKSTSEESSQEVKQE